MGRRNRARRLAEAGLAHAQRELAARRSERERYAEELAAAVRQAVLDWPVEDGSVVMAPVTVTSQLIAAPAAERAGMSPREAVDVASFLACRYREMAHTFTPEDVAATKARHGGWV